MRRRVIPSTTALRVFETAARHLTCTGTAEELFLTQSAVSKQLISLEETLGVKLFVRVSRGLVLTAAGRIYLEKIRPILDDLAAASSLVVSAKDEKQSLTLRVLATLGERWLLPRYAEFADQNPDIDIQFTSYLSRDRREHAEPDGEFRFGEGVWPNSVADYLGGRELVLVCSPRLIERRGEIEHVSDILSHTLLQHFEVPHAWNELFEYADLKSRKINHTVRYEFYSVLIRAACAGLGLALVPRLFIHDELVKKELINPLGLSVQSRFAYYFVVPKSRMHDATLTRFRDWLRSLSR